MSIKARFIMTYGPCMSNGYRKQGGKTMINKQSQTKDNFLFNVAKEILGFQTKKSYPQSMFRGDQVFTVFGSGYYTGLLAPKNLYKIRQVGFNPSIVRNSLKNPYYKFISGRIE